ncbi:MAG: aminopeptidase P family protein [Mucilaginibacter sp.]|uniref:aminopeptidase P family protein n=1 Tax=Mucilaginibacter sp. TaxID=1882438 RepID=UPI0032669FBE
MFSSETYINRRELIKNKLQTGILLFLGNEESAMNYQDNTYPFRQDSTFLYYFGISSPGLAAIIDIDENREIIFGDEMSIDDIVWMGRQETLAEKSKKTGISNIQPYNHVQKYLERAMAKQRPVNFLPPYRPENKIKLGHLFGINLQALTSAVSVPFIKAVVEQRSVKSTEELDKITLAVNTTSEMHLMAMRTARPGMTENDIAALIHAAALAKGGSLAYPVILTVHGEILHNHSRGNIFKDGNLILNDSGFETAMGYCADLTRTFPAGKTFTSKQRDVYNIVANAVNTAATGLKPGKKFLDVHFTACKVLAEGLKELGLMKGNVDDAVAAGAHAMFFQCGTGHMMGLDVHDMEDMGEQYVGYTEMLKKETKLFGLKSLRLGKELEPGFVFTIEPGIYIIPELIDLWRSENKFADFINYSKLEEYRDFGGIRIENNYAITANGYKILGNPLAETVEEIENIRSFAY